MNMEFRKSGTKPMGTGAVEGLFVLALDPPPSTLDINYDSVLDSREVSAGMVASAVTARIVGRPPEVVTVRSR